MNPDQWQPWERCPKDTFPGQINGGLIIHVFAKFDKIF